MADRTPGRLDLLGEARRRDRPAGPSEQRPADATWRADALAASRHSRLEVGAVTGEPDEAAAQLLCADLSRQVLGDLAPALVLLPAARRRRAQALAAYTFILFDFVRQSGVEGERLAAINRWEASLDAALMDGAARQPVFVALAAEHRRRPWPLPALDDLAAIARNRILLPVPRTAAEAAARDAALGVVLATALLGEETAVPPRAASELAAALLALAAVRGLAEDLRRHRPQLAADELGWPPPPGAELEPQRLAAAAEHASRRVRQRLAGALEEVRRIPRPWRRAAAFLALAGRRLAASGADPLAAPPRLGLAVRLGLLARARWVGR